MAGSYILHPTSAAGSLCGESCAPQPCQVSQGAWCVWCVCVFVCVCIHVCMCVSVYVQYVCGCGCECTYMSDCVLCGCFCVHRCA